MKDKGFSLVEVLVALAIFGMLFGSIYALLKQEDSLVRNSANALNARLIANEVMENLKIYPFEKLASSSFARSTELKNMGVNVFVSDFGSTTLKKIVVTVRWIDSQGQKKYFVLSTLRSSYTGKLS